VAVSLTLSLAAVEFYFRVRFPIEKVVWPGQFVEGVGWTFTPGEEVQHTNFVDYATTTPVNSIGFLDREPEPAADDDVFRIAFLGDSFVEAAQVAIGDKMQVQLEEILHQELPDRRFRTYGFGYSGCGTSNVLPFYTEYARQYEPDLVVLVFVSNDLANNSPVLESIRNGWHPYHPPRFFFESGADGARPVAVDPTWHEKTLKTPLPPAPEPTAADEWLSWSRCYQHFKSKWATGNFARLKLYHERAAELAAMDPAFAAMLADYDPAEEDMDAMFFAEDLPPVFENALESTKASFRRFQELCEVDGARLLVLVHEQCTGQRSLQRTAVANGYRDRIVAILDDLDIDYLDLHGVATARGEPSDMHFSRDGHWSPTGHRWVAEGTAEYLVRRADTLLQPREAPPRPR